MLYLTVFLKLLIFLVSSSNKSQARQEYTYIPDSACRRDPPPSSSPGSFSLWGFLTAGIVASTVVGNIISSINSNNNNNNNNDNNNQINNNNVNMNMNDGQNSNMNTNMIIPGRRKRDLRHGNDIDFDDDTKTSGPNSLKNCALYVLCRALHDENNKG